MPPTANATPQGPVLVAGGAGYIGSHTVRLLQERGVDVVVLDNLSSGHRAATTAALEVVDLGDRSELARVLRQHAPVAVVHFAAKCYVQESVTDPARYYLENVHHTWCLLEAMRAAGCRDLVFSSTCATYGEPHTVPIPDDHPQQPINPYGRTKLHMEHMLQDYGHAYGLRWAALRYFNAAGAARDGVIGEDHSPETHLIPLVLQVALGQRESISVFGDDYPTRDGSCERDYVHVEDLADAHLRALSLLQGGTPHFACNLGTGAGFTVKELIEEARRITGHPIPSLTAGRRAGDPAKLVSGGRLARTVLGWEPRRSDLHTILEDSWRWHRGHPGGYPKA